MMNPVPLRKVQVEGFSAADAAAAATAIQTWLDARGEQVLIGWQMTATDATVEVLIFYMEG